ncbi:hypothetical protein ED28_00790 [[Pantoea] beijingensis]|uniref:DUF1090 domain-containing protein n=1 Tax=[Pantoea] beijingensis TaxID=1324864 RepID=A0A443IHP6_9GAMM|nr:MULTISPECIES: DUF1090 domain-containing protein [Erwiniaceae]RWR03552.1 hypothetical protein ED28_00790 [[Pantoea] beijingensis]
MKKLTKLAILPLLMTLGSTAFTVAQASGNDCSAKRAAIENQIRQAERYGNHYKVDGLRKALAELNAHCTNDGLVRDAQKKVTKLEGKLADKQRDVREVQADLREAQARHNYQKISKYEKKLAEKRNDVNKIQAELNAARAELAGLRR